MPNTIEIVVRVAADQASAALKGVQTGLQQAGVQAKVAEQALKSHEQAVTSLKGSLENLIRSIVAVGTAMMVMRRAFDFFKESIEAVERFNASIRQTAEILDTVTKEPTLENFGRNMDYARREMELLERAALKYGVQLEQLVKFQKVFIEAGYAPKTGPDVEAFAIIARAFQDMNIRGENQRALMREITGILMGHVTPMSAIATLVSRQVGDYQQWIALHRQQGDLETAIAGKLQGVAATHQSLTKEIGFYVGQLKTAREMIERTAAAGAQERIAEAFGRLTKFLEGSSEVISARLKPAFDSLGRAVSDLIDFTIKNWDKFVDAIKMAMGFLTAVLNVVRLIGQALAFQIGGTTVGKILLEMALGATMLVVATRLVGAVQGIALALRTGIPPMSVGAAILALAAPLVLEGAEKLGAKVGAAGAAEATASTAASLAATQRRFAGKPGFDAQGNIIQRPGGLPGLPGLAPSAEFGTKAAGAERAVWEIAKDKINEAYQYQLRLNNALDDKLAKEKADLSALEAKIIAYQKLVATMPTGTPQQRAAREKMIEEIFALQTEQASKEKALRRDTIADHIKASEEFIAHQKAMNQMSTQDEIAAYERIYAYAESVHYPNMRSLDEKLHALRKELRRKEFDEQLRHLKESYDVSSEAISFQERRAGAEARRARAVPTARITPVFTPLGTIDTRAMDQAIQVQTQITEQAQREVGFAQQRVDETERYIAQLQQALAGNLSQEEHDRVTGDLKNAQRRRDEQILDLEDKRTTVMEAQNRVLDEQVKKYDALMEPIRKAVQGTQSAIEGAFVQAWDNVLTGAESLGQALVNVFRNIGRAIINQIGQFVAMGLTNMLMGEPGKGGLGDVFTSLYGSLYKGMGLGSPAEAAAAAGLSGVGESAPMAATGLTAVATAAQAAAAALASMGGGGGLFMSSAGAGLVGGGFESVPLDLLAVSMQAGGVVARTGLAYVHQGEAVVPEGSAYGGGRGGSVIHIYAWDTVSGMDQLYKHREFLGEMYAEQRGVNDRTVRRVS